MSLYKYVENYETCLENFKEACITYLKSVGISKTFESLTLAINDEFLVSNLHGVKLYDYLDEMDRYIRQISIDGDVDTKTLFSIIFNGYKKDDENFKRSDSVPDNEDVFELSVKWIMSKEPSDIVDIINKLPHTFKTIVESILYSLLMKSDGQYSTVFESHEWEIDKRAFLIGLVTMGQEKNKKLSTLLIIYGMIICFYMLDVYQLTRLDFPGFNQIVERKNELIYIPLYLKGMISSSMITGDVLKDDFKKHMSELLDCLSNYIPISMSVYLKIKKPEAYLILVSELESKKQQFNNLKTKRKLRMNTSEFFDHKKYGVTIWLWMMSLVGTQALEEATKGFLNIIMYNLK